MDKDRSETQRWAALTGFGALVLGAVGGALERGWPSASNPVAVADFIATHRSAIPAQSMVFLLSTGIYLWFLGVLRGFVLRAEGGTGTLGTVAFGAGCVWAGISMAAQAFQIGVAIAPTPAGGRVGGAGDEYLPVAQAALVAAVAPATMRGWIRDGRLRRYHAGRELRILRSDLERLLRADPRPSSAVITPEDAAALIERRRRRRPHAGRRS
jgi:hypothetical protein